MELPITDDGGATLISFTRASDAPKESTEAHEPPVCALVIVHHNELVLFGFHAIRRQWEIPGGTLERDEPPVAAAIRELAEETGIHASRADFVGRAVFSLATTGQRIDADVFAVRLDEAPVLVASDELDQFLWCDLAGLERRGLSSTNAEIARRSLHPDPHRDMVE